MGAWGLGPFDSDSALDFLGNLADRHANIDTDYRVVPGTVNHDGVHAALAEALAAVTRPATENEYRWGTVDEAYAAAGLVAAAVTGQHTDQPAGTSLFEQSTGLNLDRHCGYVDLLPADKAPALLPAAVRAVTAIQSETDWLEHWLDLDGVQQSLESLLAVLREHTGDATGPSPIEVDPQ